MKFLFGPTYKNTTGEDCCTNQNYLNDIDCMDDLIQKHCSSKINNVLWGKSGKNKRRSRRITRKRSSRKRRSSKRKCRK